MPQFKNRNISAPQLQAILNGISDGITVLNTSGQFIYVNGAAAAMCGFSSPEEFLSATAEEVMAHFDIKDENGNPYSFELLPGRLALNGIKDPPEVIVQFRYRNSAEVRWSIIKASPVFDENKKVLMAVSIFKDYTERKLLEQKTQYLDEATRILNSSLDYKLTLKEVAKLAVPQIADWCSVDIRPTDNDFPENVAVEHFDPEKIKLAELYSAKYPTDWNVDQGATRVIRTGRAELYSEIPDKLLKQSCKSEQHYLDILQLGLKSAMIVPLSSRDRTFGVISLFAAESGRIFNAIDLRFAEELARRAGIAIDNARLFSEAEMARKEQYITLQKLERLAEIAESASQAKSLFLANMSHEIRTPLGAILGFADFLNEPHLTEADRTKYTEVIHRNGQLLTQLIEDILNLSKVEAGHLEIETIQVPLNRILSDISAIMNLRAQEKGLNLIFISAEDVPVFIYSDPTRLRQILINLIGNAIKFTERGSVTVTVSKEISKSSDTDHIIFIIEDTGPGIDPADRDKLFEWFTQADSSTTRKFGGTGLGLALSRRLARKLGGDVKIEDPIAFGARFVVSIAARLGNTKPDGKNIFSNDLAKLETTKHKTEDASLQGLRILLVDDSTDNRALIEKILSRIGVKVQTGTNGLEGVEQALSNEFDVVLMDIQMPLMDGLEATKQLRQKGYTKPIIALTAHAMNIEREKTKEAGCDAHLTKPIDVKQLTSTLARFANLKA